MRLHLLAAGLSLVAAATAHGQSIRSHLPLHAQADGKVGDGYWVHVRCTLSDGPKPRLDGTIECKCHNHLTGFCGTAFVRFLDGKGNVLFIHQCDSIGVNACDLFGILGRTTCTKVIHCEVPPHIADRTRNLVVECYKTGDPPLVDKIKEAKELLDALTGGKK